MNWEGAEKRRFVRAKFPCKITIHTPEEKTISTNTEDIGAGGVRVILNEQLQMALPLDLQLILENKFIACKGKIVWVLAKKDSQGSKYDTGIEFYEITEGDRGVINGVVNLILAKEQ